MQKDAGPLSRLKKGRQKMRNPGLFRGMAGIAVIALATVLALSACSSGGETLSTVDVPGGPIDVSDSSVNVVLVTGSNVRGNVKRTSEFPSQVEDAFVTAFQTGGEAAVVSVEGEPRLFPMDGMQSSAASPDIRMEENEAAVRSALGSVCQGGIAAASPEADCSAAIALGGRMLSGAECEGSVEVMLVADSLLSSSGSVSFGEYGIPIGGVDPAEVVERLAEASMVPDLSSVDRVCVFYLGDSASPQQAPSQADKSWLESFWTAFFETAGTSVAFSQVPPASSDSDDAVDLPRVSVVPLGPGEESHWAELSEGDVVELDSDGEGAFAFKPDSPEFVDEGFARQEVVMLAAEVNALPGTPIVEVAGHTAGDGDGSELSLKRAERVVALLVDAGVDPSALVAHGYGCESSPSHQHVPDVEDGRLVEDAATKNRLVTLWLVDGQDDQLDRKDG